MVCKELLEIIQLMFVFRDAQQEVMAIVIPLIDIVLLIALKRALQILAQLYAWTYVQLLPQHLAIQEIGHALKLVQSIYGQTVSLEDVKAHVTLILGFL